MYEIRKHKTEIREFYKAKRKALDEELKLTNDGKIVQHILTSATYRYADILLMYLPKAEEINIAPVAEAAIAAGKKVAFPRCNPEDHTMKFHYVENLLDFDEGSYGMKEPKEELPVFDMNECERGNVVCIVPGVVYDKRGFRIGYGGGYYDRYLSGFRGTKVGVAYTDFIVGSVPHGRFDLAVDVMISERGIYAKK